MKKFRIIICVFVILSLIFFNWNDISNEHNIINLLLCSVAILFTVFICISLNKNWKETRPVLVSVVEGCTFALFGILSAFAAWNFYSVKGDIAMSLLGGTLALVSIIISFSSFFKWQKNRPKLYSVISIVIPVLLLFSFLAFFILRIMSVPVE